MAVEGGTVLVVTGTDTGERTTDRLASAGAFDVVTAASVPEALDAFDERRVDCVVSGHEIPDGEGVRFHGGLALLRAVRDRNSSVPFVFFSDVDNEEIVRTAVTEGVSDVVTRYDDEAADRLLGRVEHAVARQRAERRADREQRINRVIRDVNQALVRADSRAEIEDTVCRTLTATDTYHLAALGRYAEGAFRIHAAVPGTFPSAGLPPAEALAGKVRAYRGDDSDWAARLTDGTVATVPVSFPGGRFGHLLVAAERRDAFDPTEREVLAELGETLAHALDAARVRSELERKNERLEHFASVLSHDLRNPLQVAFGRLGLLAAQRDSDHVDRIEESLQRMQELVDDILALIHHEEAALEPATIDLASISREAWNGVETGDATLAIDDGLGTVAADRSRLRQLFENLFRNAVEHGATSTRQSDSGDTDATDGVRVRVVATDDGFAVCDDGPGIPEPERERVFELDYTTAAAGTGLGLAIVREVAADHGWDVTVGESEMGGARFEIRT
ncbi:MAG: ATP-binding protein [Haloarculaceae archaeon]